jgi:hypothetical protein
MKGTRLVSTGATQYKKGSQEADDDGRPAEWHAGKNKKTDDRNKDQSAELQVPAERTMAAEE